MFCTYEVERFKFLLLSVLRHRCCCEMKNFFVLIDQENFSFFFPFSALEYVDKQTNQIKKSHFYRGHHCV